MSARVDPEDFSPCVRCGQLVLLVSYWDELLQVAGERFVDPSFDYPFEKRDFKGRLVVHEKERVMRACHDWTCPKLPPAPPPPAAEESERESRKGQRAPW